MARRQRGYRRRYRPTASQKPAMNWHWLACIRCIGRHSRGSRHYRAIENLGGQRCRTAELFVFNDKKPTTSIGAQGLAPATAGWWAGRTPGQDAFIPHMRYYIRWLANILALRTKRVGVPGRTGGMP